MAEHVPSPEELAEKIGGELGEALRLRSQYRSHTGTWNSACPHRRRAGMTVVPCSPCVPCVREGRAARIMAKSECGNFEFLHWRGQQVVVCTRCWRYGKPGQNHECLAEGLRRPRLVDGKKPVDPRDEYLESMIEVLGLTACWKCEGSCSNEPDSRGPCKACGGSGISGEPAPAAPDPRPVVNPVTQGSVPLYTGLVKERF